MYELVAIICIMTSPVDKPCTENSALAISIVRGFDAQRCIAAQERLRALQDDSNPAVRRAIFCRISGADGA